MPNGPAPPPRWPLSSLPAAARKAWGKHDWSSEESLPLWRHLADSSTVAERLWDAWLPHNVKRLVSDALPDGERDGRALVSWMAGVHDVGKCTAAFACQVESLAQNMRAEGLEMATHKQYGRSRSMAPHGLAGQLLLREWLAERFGWSRRASAQFGVVVGGHHGVPPTAAQVTDLELHDELLWTPGHEQAWRHAQFALLDACATAAGVEDRLDAWREVRLPQPVQVVLTAVVIVSDWIASSSELFPYSIPDGGWSEQGRLESAWAALDLPAPWQPEAPEGAAQDLVSSRFALPEGATIRPVQEESVRLAREMPEPGLLIVEAPMGEGKTEAALAAAEVLAARSGAGGCFMALPTQATVDAMFPRLLSWVGELPGEGGKSVFLAHAKRVLNREYAGLLRGGGVSHVDCRCGEEDEEKPDDRRQCKGADLLAHEWLMGRKKLMLASFGVGTIDQLLFAALKSRHLMLRHLALAGKVVVIDEVHAYDAYMSVYVERALHWLGAYRVPVVMLSATLPAARRRALAEAYGGAESAAVADGDAYPLLTAVSPGSPPITVRTNCAADRGTTVVVERLDDDLDILAGRLETALAGGGCALVVRNTVDRAHQVAERLRERFGRENVTVAHSRFLAADRARKDRELLERFGSEGARPKGPHVVVGTQVLEQSLDVDFDLLVTDLAPVDLMLQRMGRLHRHPRRRPARLETARCLVTGVDWSAPVPEPVAGSRAVYKGRYLLLRSLAVLWPHLEGRGLRLPDDISRLVQPAYGEDPVGPPEWAGALEEARARHRSYLAGQRERAESYLLGKVRRPGRPLLGWVDAGVGEAKETPSGRAQVRDGEESLEVLVVQQQADGTVTTVPWLEDGKDGLPLPVDTAPSPHAMRAVAESSLRLPGRFCRPELIDSVIDELEDSFYPPGWQNSQAPLLKGQLFLVLDERCQTRLADSDLYYDRDDGLLVMPAGAHDVKVVDRVPSFDLVSRAWLPVQLTDGSRAELSLREVFARAGEVRRLVGDVPTQEFALLRLLLAIVHDAVDGPAELDDWEELWRSDESFGEVLPYLERHREKSFDLLHPATPFMQVADLRTAKDEVSSLNRIVADVPNGEPFFSMRQPGVEYLTLPEAARWLVHAHAFDPSGIKSGAVGDPRVKAGKGYPQGVAWSGNLGGVLAEGANLRETLLLNLISDDFELLRDPENDRPAWRRQQEMPYTAAPFAADADEPRPSGPRDLYTWQSRRIRLHLGQVEGAGPAITGVVLAYGDTPAVRNRQNIEPMTGWRRSAAQEKKLRQDLVYMPLEHDPTRSVWQGLTGLLFSGDWSGAGRQRHGGAALLRPRVVEWLAWLVGEDALDRTYQLRTRTVGARYGTQQSVIDEMIDDGIDLAGLLLHEEDGRFRNVAVKAVSDAEYAVSALGHLASDLARAARTQPEPALQAARDLGFAALDGHYRRWLRELGRTVTSPDAAHAGWRRTVRSTITALKDDLLRSAGPAAWEGQVIPSKRGDVWLNSTQAELWFAGRLNRALGDASDAPDDEPTEGTA